MKPNILNLTPDEKVALNISRVRELGNWPSYISDESLLSRVPILGSGSMASGFDAGVACALDLIPRDRQRLSCILHAAYTQEAVEQIRKEAICFKKASHKMYDGDYETDSNCETVWWLAASSFCKDGEELVTYQGFGEQVNLFIFEANNSHVRFNRASYQFDLMRKSFIVADGVAISTKDGGMQGAYVHGYPLAIAPLHNIWFVGTYHPTLGIPEDFKWGTTLDTQGRPASGPVHGSKQFVKCANLKELASVVEFARSTIK